MKINDFEKRLNPIFTHRRSLIKDYLSAIIKTIGRKAAGNSILAI
jgi:hypothetical protein